MRYSVFDLIELKDIWCRLIETEHEKRQIIDTAGATCIDIYIYICVDYKYNIPGISGVYI